MSWGWDSGWEQGWEQGLFVAAALCACGFMLWTRPDSRRRATLACLAVLLPVLGALLLWRPPDPPLAAIHTPQKTDDQGYVSSVTCRACHVAEYESWRKSYHRTMTQVASPETIAAPHESASLSGNGRSFRVHFEEDVMWTEDIHPYATLDYLQSTVSVLPGPNFVSSVEPTIPANIKKFRSQVVMATGSHHMQIYWQRDRKGAFRHLSWVWLIRDQRWVPGEAVYLQPPGGVMGLAGQWETNCIKCHSVGGQPRIDRTTPRPPGTSEAPPRESKVGELGIACEACHGPAQDHVRANRSPLRRYATYLFGDGDPTIVHPNEISQERSSEICGRCHSGHQQLAWDERTGTPFKAGDSLEEFFQLRDYDSQPAHERSGYFWNDGTARVTGREYSAMIRSACYTRGEIGCNSCHSMHDSDPDDQLTADRDSDTACLNCHADFADRIAEHTHHPEGSTGARCYNCHMPNTTYGLLSMTRSHRIDNPSLAMTTRDGRPNACNLCHVDQTLAWAGEHLENWYGQEKTPLTADEEEIPAAALWLLAGDAAQRATAAWHLGWEPVLERSGTGWQTPLLAESLGDPYTAVRYLAERSIRKFPAFDGFDFDFVVPAKDQTAAVASARAISRRSLDRPSPAPPSLDRSPPAPSSPSLAPELVERLRSQRDETPISFQE